MRTEKSRVCAVCGSPAEEGSVPRGSPLAAPGGCVAPGAQRDGALALLATQWGQGAGGRALDVVSVCSAEPCRLMSGISCLFWSRGEVNAKGKVWPLGVEVEGSGTGSVSSSVCCHLGHPTARACHPLEPTSAFSTSRSALTNLV